MGSEPSFGSGHRGTACRDPVLVHAERTGTLVARDGGLSTGGDSILNVVQAFHRRRGQAEMCHQGSVPAGVEPVVPLLDYQRTDIESDARFSWCCWSRQIGKSFTKSLRRVLRGILRRRNQILLSAGERQSRELMVKVRQHCQALNIASREVNPRQWAVLDVRAMSLELPNGVRVIGLPANPLTARGFTGDVFLDEFAMHRDDREIWAAVFPSVLRGGGELDVASTPKGRDNLFAHLRDNPQFAHSVVTLDEAVSAGLEADPKALRLSMNDDELYRQEFLCEFLDEASAFLTYEQIRRVEDPFLEKDFDMARISKLRGPLFAGMDIARHRDLTVIWLVELTETAIDAGHPHPVLATRGVCELRGEPFRAQSARLHELLSLRQVRRCCIDASGMGMPLAEAAVEAFGSVRVEGVAFTAAVKDELAGRLRVRVEDGAIRIPVDEAIRNDWHSVRRSAAAIGPARYEAARGIGGHADRFWTACLAIRAAGSAALTGPAECYRGPGLRFARDGIW